MNGLYIWGGVGSRGTGENIFCKDNNVVYKKHINQENDRILVEVKNLNIYFVVLPQNCGKTLFLPEGKKRKCDF